MNPIDCATGTLAPYVPDASAPWDKRRVLHLYRRMSFGATPAEINAALNLSPSQLVDNLINNAINLPLPPEPEWAFWDVSRYQNQEQAAEQIFAWSRRWLLDMLNHGFREKLALFWHNHFVTRQEDYGCPSYLYQYHKLLQQYALGNFKNFVKEIGKTPAMLVFLNGVQNTRFNPNENYARELYELFTLGRDNGYTQQDIVQTARALTGWNSLENNRYCGKINFLQTLYDPGQKTIFGKSGNYNYDTLHDLLFTERAVPISEYICAKLYRHFVSPTVDETIVKELALVFRSNNFEIAPVLRTLFKSEHFFAEANWGVIVKSPLELELTFIREGGFNINWTDETLTGLLYLAGELGQNLFNPVDVAGWQGNRTWVNSNTLTGRWQVLRFIIFNLYQNYPAQLVQLARNLSNNSSDGEFITELIINHFLVNGLQTPEEYDRAFISFQAEIPVHYFEDGSWNLNWETAPAQVALLLDHLIRKPEFQLM
ncbi:MAG: DUF1800 family protein [Saprospiraceae bacterium]